MKYLAEREDLRGKVQLIYIDPPFFSKAKYGMESKLAASDGSKVTVKQLAYTDTWDSGLYEYLKMLCVRFYMMRELLSDEGCLWLHLDWHVVHYARVLLDAVFGEKNFVNEIVWQYKSGGSSRRRYARKHDTLLFYGKTPKYYFCPQQEKSYNRGLKPYRFKGVKEYRDELGWYTMVNMKDVWQIDMVGRTSGERTGYATQKPEALMRRIVESCSREGDIVADFFGGSGSLCAAAEKLGRRWIYCDSSRLAAANAEKRFAAEGMTYSFIEERGGTDTVKASADVKLYAERLAEGKQHLNLKLCGYGIENVKRLPVEAESLNNIRKLLKKDPIALVDFWSVDWRYDGRTFRPDTVIRREKGSMDRSCDAIGSGFEKAAVKVTDIFGNSAFLVKDLMEDLNEEN